MIAIEAGSPYTPIGEAPENSDSSFFVLISLALIATSIIALQSQGNYYTFNKD